MKRRAVLLAPLVFYGLRTARAEPVAIGGITVSHPWVPPAVTEAAALFMKVVNDGPVADRLIAAATPVASAVIFRARDGTPLEYYDLLPKRALTLAPGRRYIALRDLKAPLALDDTFPVTLHFEHAGQLIVTAVVEAGPEDDGSG